MIGPHWTRRELFAFCVAGLVGGCVTLALVMVWFSYWIGG